MNELLQVVMLEADEMEVRKELHKVGLAGLDTIRELAHLPNRYRARVHVNSPPANPYWTRRSFARYRRGQDSYPPRGTGPLFGCGTRNSLYATPLGAELELSHFRGKTQ